jgi:hypothetical protein
VLPNFLIIGAPKCGTTTLYHQLSQHPEIFMCTPKEPAFFSRDNIYRRGLAWYESLFEQARRARLLGEATTGYTTSVSAVIAAERIAKHIPHARLIYCVRHPLRRIESIWMDYASYGAFGLHRARKLRLFRDFCATVRHNPGFVDTSCYWARLNTYWERFPDHQIHVVFLEDLQEQPHETLVSCFRFLGCDPGVAVAEADKRRNVSSKKTIPTRLGLLLRYAPQTGPMKLARRLFAFYLPSLLESPLRRPCWDAELLHHVVDRLYEDTTAFLAHCGKPSNFWDLNQEIIRNRSAAETCKQRKASP